MNLKGIKINVLGDSITQGVGASCIEKCFVNVLAAKTGATVNNYGISGTRIARQKLDIPAPHFNTPYCDRIPEMDKDADVVLIFGGTNDFGHGDAPFGEYMSDDEWTFCGAFNMLMKKLFVAFPDSEIVVLTPLHRASENVTTNEIGIPCHPLSDYVEMEKKYCEHYGVPVLDLWSVSGIQPCDEVLRERFAPDTLHPNDRGHERIADRIIGFLSTLK